MMSFFKKIFACMGWSIDWWLEELLGAKKYSCERCSWCPKLCLFLLSDSNPIDHDRDRDINDDHTFLLESWRLNTCYHFPHLIVTSWQCGMHLLKIFIVHLEYIFVVHTGPLLLLTAMQTRQNPDMNYKMKIMIITLKLLQFPCSVFWNAEIAHHV